ncbi:MAG: hypothetical protein PHX60_09155 [Giesbergeria sp.]|uniref:hypothetical protein n=1 Tax=Giesbergeria sp. TaxID=2818473 RepID=UPI00262CE4A8|nr:hypothetical protein [Giesbergeria sp.]MDD2609844.1 hypothetical protein [Giesbergeria sp.]
MRTVPAEVKKQVLSLDASPVDGKTFRMPLFRPGTVVLRAGKKHTVSHVMIRKGELLVYLHGVDAAMRPETLRVAPALFSIERQKLR